LTARVLAYTAVIDAWRARPLVYGSGDCCQFVAEMIVALRGEDLRHLFPAYSSQAEAEDIIAAHGGLVGLVSHALGEPSHPSRAIAGDAVVYQEEDGREVAGVCIGARIAAPGPAGLVFPSMSRAIASWRL